MARPLLHPRHRLLMLVALGRGRRRYSALHRGMLRPMSRPGPLRILLCVLSAALFASACAASVSESGGLGPAADSATTQTVEPAVEVEVDALESPDNEAAPVPTPDVAGQVGDGGDELDQPEDGVEDDSTSEENTAGATVAPDPLRALAPASDWVVPTGNALGEAVPSIGSEPVTNPAVIRLADSYPTAGEPGSWAAPLDFDTDLSELRTEEGTWSIELIGVHTGAPLDGDPDRVCNYVLALATLLDADAGATLSSIDVPSFEVLDQAGFWPRGSGNCDDPAVRQAGWLSRLLDQIDLRSGSTFAIGQAWVREAGSQGYVLHVTPSLLREGIYVRLDQATASAAESLPIAPDLVVGEIQPVPVLAPDTEVPIQQVSGSDGAVTDWTVELVGYLQQPDVDGGTCTVIFGLARIDRNGDDRFFPTYTPSFSLYDGAQPIEISRCNFELDLELWAQGYSRIAGARAMLGSVVPFFESFGTRVAPSAILIHGDSGTSAAVSAVALDEGPTLLGFRNQFSTDVPRQTLEGHVVELFGTDVTYDHDWRFEFVGATELAGEEVSGRSGRCVVVYGFHTLVREADSNTRLPSIGVIAGGQAHEPWLRTSCDLGPLEQAGYPPRDEGIVGQRVPFYVDVFVPGNLELDGVFIEGLSEVLVPHATSEIRPAS